VRIINKDQRAHEFRLSSLGIANAAIDSDALTQYVNAEDVKTVVVRVRIPAAQEHGGHDFSIVAQAVDQPGLEVISRARFFAAP
jgi:hypothetical protein